MPTLEVSRLEVNYGAVRAVSEVSIAVESGEVVVVLGPNGAGKSSSLRAIAGLIKSRGSVAWDGADISRWSAFRRARAGIALVPEGRRVFAPLTVEENLMLGAYGMRSAANRRSKVEEIFRLFPRLETRRKSHSGLLSGGEQQMLAIGRALMAEPSLILMDEPSMGLAPTVVDIVMDSVKAIAATGIGVLMVEQNAIAALDIADRAAVLNRGAVVAIDDAHTLREHPAVLRAFLGSQAVHDTAESGQERAAKSSGPVSGS